MNQISQEILAQIASKQAMVRARVREVARGKVAAMFIHGPGGHGKSHIIKAELNSILGKGNWQHHNSNTSAPGMRDALQDHPHGIHFCEDMEPSLTGQMPGILRSACGRVGGEAGEVTWRTARQSIRFTFHGGIIIASNENLANDRIMGAVASRMKPMLWQLLPEEIKATIFDAAAKGINLAGELVSPEEAIEVAEFVIELMDEGNEVDLRSYFEHSLPSYLNWKHEVGVNTIQQKYSWLKGHASTDLTVHWKDIVRCKLEGQAAPETMAKRLLRDRLTACECYRDGKDTDERIALWTDRTGFGKQAFYNRIKDAKANGLFHQICD